MPFVRLNDAQLYYEFSGSQGAPVLLFSNSLGTNTAMWNSQVSALAKDLQILRYDTRGHGQSPAAPGPYRIEQLADDVLALLDRLGISQVHFCGLSMGGMIGMSIALRAPQRLRKLVLCNTAPKIATPEIWNARMDAVRNGGMAAVVDGVLERWFTPDFRASAPEQIESTRKMLLGTPVDGYIATCAAIREMDARESIANIKVPTLIISGMFDPVTPPQDGHFMAGQIAGSHYKELPAAHLSNIEASAGFTMELLNFLRA